MRALGLTFFIGGGVALFVFVLGFGGRIPGVDLIQAMVSAVSLMIVGIGIEVFRKK